MFDNFPHLYSPEDVVGGGASSKPNDKSPNENKVQKLRRVEIAIYLLLAVCFPLTFVLGSILYFIGVYVLFILLYYVIRNRIMGSVKDIVAVRPKSARFEWLDMFRGLVVIFLIISVLTWSLSGVKNDGVPDPTQPPIGPTYLNHGWKYASIPGWPNMITIIDIGQQILMFVMGFASAIAYYSHVDKEGELAATLHFIRRFMALMFISIVVEAVGTNFNINELDLIWIFWRGTFPSLAWGGLGANIVLRLLKRRPDQRIIVAVLIMVLHGILYEIPAVRAWQWVIGEQVYMILPFNTLNHIPIAIAGTCAYDWFRMNTEADPYKGWRERILPMGAICFAVNYLWDYVQPADHGDATTALALNAIATSLFMLFIFYSFVQAGFIIRPLVTMGKNVLFLFALTLVWDPWMGLFDHAYLATHRFIAMIVIGVVPIVGSWAVAKLLEKKNIIIKF